MRSARFRADDPDGRIDEPVQALTESDAVAPEEIACASR